MKNDVDITFGKSVLIEKTLKQNCLAFLNPLTKEVEGSFLHVITGTQTETVIRYAKFNAESNYYVIRIVMFHAKSSFKKTSNPFGIALDTNSAIREILFHFSSRDFPCASQIDDIQIIDSKPIICHKDGLSEVILKTYNSMLNFHKSIKNRINEPVPIPRSLIPSNSDTPISSCELTRSNSLYGKEEGYTYDHYIGERDLKALQYDVNSWLQKLKRKGRRLLTKSLYLDIQ